MPQMGHAQSEGKVQLHGSVQSEFTVPEEDKAIGTTPSSDDVLNNTYVDLGLTSKYIDAGARLEYMEHPLQGFEEDFKGWGVPHIYIKGRYKGMELTLGDYYEQFGSGLILRSYEERSLGIDNSLRGGRLKVNAIKGLHFTALAGTQRRYWDWEYKNYIMGADAELSISDLAPAWQEKGIDWMIGGSWVDKYEHEDADQYTMKGHDRYHVNMPKYVNSFDVRTRFQKNNFSILAEYAWKDQDPSLDNSFTFHRGNAAFISASYSKTGLSALFQVKRSENMSYRSSRSVQGISSFINNMPAFAYQHTYALAALYPYATQYGKINPTGSSMTPGEWALQGEFAYTFPKKSALGGKYGTKVKVSASHIRGLDYEPAKPIGNSMYGTEGYKSKVFGWSDESFYEDYNVQIDKKVNKQLKLNFMYMYQKYNRLVDGHEGNIYSHIMIGEGKYQFNKKLTLRAEAQYLLTAHESGDWGFGLLELSVSPHFMFTISDQIGHPEVDGKYGDVQHYYMGMVTYTIGAHRIAASYGRTRAGFNCSGGVCRWIPANRGVSLNYNFTF